MARSESTLSPLTNEEHEEVREALRELRSKTRQHLAEELGGEPEDHEVNYPHAKRLDE
jgi:NTP pyrophosphatase (non-canonical NTP hydrolase)